VEELLEAVFCMRAAPKLLKSILRFSSVSNGELTVEVGAWHLEVSSKELAAEAGSQSIKLA
jgi:hypothetical protein